MPHLKLYRTAPGVPVQSSGRTSAPELPTRNALGYPTQKPLALLERIIEASCNEGDVVLDPFCGCGTAVDAAQKLHRRWIGIDITYLAIDLIRKRMRHTSATRSSRLTRSTASPPTRGRTGAVRREPIRL